MTRALLALVILCAVMAVMTSSRDKPLLVSEFHHADFPVCVTVQPGPLKPLRKDWLHPNSSSEKV